MKKCMILGDTHGLFGHIYKVVSENNPDMVIQVGDFGWWPKFGHFQDRISILKSLNLDIYFIDGNHEDHNYLRDYSSRTVEFHKNSILEDSNIFYLPRWYVMELYGFNLLFIGGANSIDKHFRYEGVDWFQTETLTESKIDAISDMNIDMVVSHTCPKAWLDTMMSTVDSVVNDNDPSCDILQSVLDHFKPKWWAFGHWHTHTKGYYYPTGTSWVCLDDVGHLKPNEFVWFSENGLECF